MSTGSGRWSGPSIVLCGDRLVEEEQDQALIGDASGLERRLVVTRSRLYLGCTSLSAGAVEFVIRAWRAEHPERAS